MLERDDSVLIAIDVQPGFFGDAGPDAASGTGLPAVIARAAWLTAVARALDIPIVVTEEDAARNGPTDPSVSAAAGPGTPTFAKHVFGLAGQGDILAGVEATGRRTAVLVGAETDVCVAQSAFGLLERGFRVAVVTDATYSPGEMHELGLRRMRGAGVMEVHAKGVYYEWVRTLAAAHAFQAANPDLAEPPGFEL